MDTNRALVVERNILDEELRPFRRIRRHPMYARLKRWRHRRLGRALTWPARRILRSRWKRLSSP
jgi:isopentenyl diphosphate isomerase/L-lactate dehydrogenase-like FMN-dependent dehydrogenase